MNIMPLFAAATITIVIMLAVVWFILNLSDIITDAIMSWFNKDHNDTIYKIVYWVIFSVIMISCIIMAVIVMKGERLI